MSDRWNATWGVLDGWQRVSLLLLIVAAIGQLLFVVVYLNRRWWVARVGRALMAKAVALALILTLSVIASFFHIPQWISTLALALVAAAIWYQAYVLITSPSHYLDRQEDPYEGIQRTGSVRPESEVTPADDRAGDSSA